MPADPIGYVARPRYWVRSKEWTGIPGIDLASGTVDGTSGVNKFGGNIALAASATETVWDGSNAYTFPAAVNATHLWSAVNSVATRGLNIEVQGLDTNWAAVTQEKALDAADSTTVVALDTPLRRVFRMKVNDSTTEDQNVLCGDVAKAVTYAQITAGNSQTLMAIYTVPAGYTAYITHYYCSLNRASGGGSTIGVKTRLWARDNDNGYVRQLKHVRGVDSAANSAFDHFFDPYFKVGAKHDIFIEAENLSGSIVGDVSAGFDLYLIQN